MPTFTSHLRRLSVLVLLTSGTFSATLEAEENGQHEPSGISSSAPVDASDEELLETVIVSGTRTPDVPLELPFSVRLISNKEIEAKLAGNLSEALFDVPGVMTQKTANGQGSPFIRGFTGYRTLALIDGIRYNNSVYRDGPNEYFSLIDVNSLAAIEVIQGPSSVAHGSDAVGGTLALLTQSSEFAAYEEGHAFQSGSTRYQYAGVSGSHLGRVEYNFGEGSAWGLHVGATVLDAGDIRAADLGRQPYTGYDEWAADVRLDVALDPFWTFTAVHQVLNQDDVWRTHATVHALRFAGTDIGQDLRRLKDQNRTLSYVRLEGADLAGWFDSAALTVSYQSWKEDGDRIRSDGRQELEGFDSGMWGFDSQLSRTTRMGILTGGIDSYRDDVDSWREDYAADGSFRGLRIQGPVGDDAVTLQTGVYLQDEIELHPRLDLLLGARYSWVSLDVGKFEDPVTGLANSYSESWENVSGSGRLIWDINEAGNYKLFGGVSQAFRAPNLADVTRFGASRSDEIESASTGVSPEEFIMFEAGVKAETGPLSGTASLFHTEISDYLASTPTGRQVDGLREVTKRNSGSGYVQGFEGGLTLRAGGGFSFSAGATFLDGVVNQFTDPGASQAVREPMSRIQPATLTGALRWTHPSEKFWTELNVISAAHADQLSSADQLDTQRIPPGGTPGYEVWNVRMGWNATEHLSIFGGLENFLDEAYRVHGSGSTEPGRGLEVGAKMTF